MASPPLRLRAFAVGVPLLVGVCFLSVYADMVAKEVQFGVLQFAPPALVGLFLLSLLSRALRRWLSAAELVTIYAMLLVGVMVSTRGVIEKLIPPLAYLPYFARESNNLHQTITRHLPGWLVPFTPSAAVTLPATLRAYHEGLRPGETIPWSIWIGPLAAWFVLIACVALVFACLATLLRRRWVEEERLSFPLTTLPLALAQSPSSETPLLRQRSLWAGFTVSALVFGWSGLHANLPGLPALPTNFDISPLLTQRPWSEMDGIQLWGSLAAIGFAYFLPNDLLFSLWFFFLATRVQDLIVVGLGGQPVAIDTHNARVSTGYQAAGAYLVLVAAQLRLGWPYFARIWRGAFVGERLADDRDELMRYRSAFLGLALGFAGIVGWLAAAGMHPALAAAEMALYLFVVALVMTRAVAEAGLLMTETSFLPSHLIRLATPLHGLGGGNLSLLALTDIVFARDLRGVLLSPLMDTQKLAGDVGMKPRALRLPLILAFLIAFPTAAFCFLTVHYAYGGVNLYTYPNGNASNIFGLASATIEGNDRPLDPWVWAHLIGGAAFTAALVTLRARLAWFPLHPLGFAVAPTWSLYVFWFPFFVAWLLKAGLARFGSIQLYRRGAPFMLGLILGEFTMAAVWALMSMPAIGWNAPTFPWP